MVKLVDTGDLKFVAPIKSKMIFCNIIKDLCRLYKIFKIRFPAIFPQILYIGRRRKKAICLNFQLLRKDDAAVVKW